MAPATTEIYTLSLHDALPISERRPQRRRLTVHNESGRPVRVSSHYPFWRVNTRLEFDREAARGMRLDIPAGSSVRWGPGEVKEIGLVRYGDDDEHPS